MKVAYIIPDLQTKGGIQKFAYTVKKGLSKGILVTVKDFLGGYAHKAPVKYFFGIPALYRVLMNLRSVYYRDVLSFDVIHTWHVATADYLSPNSYIVTCHGLEILKKNIQKSYQKILTNAFMITADSTFTKKLLLENFNLNKEKIKVINPGIDTGKLLTIPRIKKNTIVIGTLSRFVERKNIINIIKALELVHASSNLDFIFYLAGTGEQKKEILQLLETVTFKWKYFGLISEDDKLHTFYPSLDIFVLPVKELENSVEGFGIVYIEANCFGVPVVASKVSGVTDAVKEGVSGIFADPESVKDIADKIKTLLKKRSNFEQSTRKWVENFSTAKISREFEKLYIECAKKKIESEKFSR